MNETAKMLMERINQAGFAMDDVLLFLDTHPNDLNALNYYHYVAQMRKEATNAYESQFGPLTVDDVQSTGNWTWLTDRWPWEGEV